MDRLFFYNGSVILDKMKPLQSQCSSGNIIRIMQVRIFKIVWGDKEEDFRYYSNIELKYLLAAFLSNNKIPAIDIPKYGVKIGNQIISQEFVIPFEGIFDTIEVVEYSSTDFWMHWDNRNKWITRNPEHHEK